MTFTWMRTEATPRRRRARRGLALGAAAALVGGLLGVGASVVTAEPAQAAVPAFECTSSTYVVTATGAISRVDPTTGAATANGQFTVPAGDSVNALALDEGGGRYIWGYDRTAGQVVRFDSTTEATDVFPGPPSTAGVVAGAINPDTGIYYFATSGALWNLYAFDTSTNTLIGQVATISGLSANGDMAFDSLGNLYAVSNADATAAGVFARVPGPIPTTAGMATLTAEVITTTPPNLGQYHSVAVVSDGSIAIGSGSTITRVRPENGATLSQTDTGIAFVDLASCAYPNLVYAQKVLPNGRYLPTDQFRLDVTSPILPREYTGITEGTDPGRQGLPGETAGPVLGLDSASFTLTEAAAGTTDFANYETSWTCTNNTDGTVLSSGTGRVADVTLPTGSTAADVRCDFTNVALLPALTLVKRVVDVLDVNGNGYNDLGDQILWAFDLHNTGNTDLTDLTVTDDVLGAAGIGVTCDPDSLAPDERVTCEADARYTITQSDVDNGQVLNTATATGTPPTQPPVNTPPSTTTTPVGGYTVTKTSDPASGSIVAIGDEITYTITVAHVGTAAVPGANLLDDLSGVLDDAAFNDDATASGGTVDFDEASGELSWVGDLITGDTVTITYSVTVTGGGDGSLDNVVISDRCEDSCVTTHSVGGFVFSKAANPASGATVATGQTVTYTLTVTQTGAAPVAGANVTDDLSGVLDDATWNDTAIASSGTVERSGESLVWSGDLGTGQVVTITYSVTVKQGGDGALRNVVTTTSPFGVCDPSAACATQHFVPPVPGLATTGGTIAWTATGLGALALLIGAGMMRAAQRRRFIRLD
ncbi:hypothetical protein RN51_02147 [Microbacterium oxydans]|uniref:DUF11 domain-containing protein n=2 Tax=Microbacterium oxydans TaxID=82380 RepID=A0A0F0KN06_9MICO|nr:hypothetical protein RN51_02147 [Microbacterium oxydans]